MFSHQGPDGTWEPYDAARCLEIKRRLMRRALDRAIQLGASRLRSMGLQSYLF